VGFGIFFDELWIIFDRECFAITLKFKFRHN
jgi:hypothetical protein